MEFIWVYLCIAASFFAALSWGLNGIFKVDAIKLSFWRSTIVTLLTCPILFLCDLPSGYLFYVVFFVAGIFGAIGDMALFHAVKLYKGSGPTRVLNMRVPLTLTLGWVLFPQSWAAIAAQGNATVALVISALILAIVSLFYITKNPVATKMVYIMSVPIILFTSIDIATKFALSVQNATELTILSIFFMSFGMVCSATVTGFIFKQSVLQADKHIIKSSTIISLTWIALMVCKNLSIVFAPNPGYYGLFVSLSCLWIMLYHKTKGEKDDMSPIAGLTLLLATVILTYIAIS